MIDFFKKILLVAAMGMMPVVSFGLLVDTDGNVATNETPLAVIDMDASKVIDLKYTTLEAVTNTVVVGYTDYAYSGDVDPTVSYSITIAMNEGNFTYTLWNSTTAAQLGTYVTNSMHATYVPFSVQAGTIVAQCSEIRRNANGLAMYSDVQELSDKIDAMDTSYFRTVGVTNKNQSVQYVYADQNVNELEILMPATGMTKDWIVYVLAATNVTLKLPPANYWCIDESVTNEISGLTPTALYFSQINDDTYCIGRQELVPVTVEDSQHQLMQAVRRKMTRKFGK